MKKAQIEMQFNWIYVAVVGVAFLLLFLSVSSAIKKSSEAKIASGAVDFFDELFVNLQASDNTEDRVLLPGMTVEVAVDRDNCNFYTIEGTDQEGRSIEFTPFFSPEFIDREALAYTLGWDIPFRASYFLYLTSPEVAYVSIGAQADLPEHLTYFNLGSAGGFVDQNYRKIRFFSSSSNPASYSLDSSVSMMPDRDVTAVFIQGNTLRFYEKEGSRFVEKGETYFSDRPTLLAAIYSDSKDSYECNMMKSLKRLNALSGVMIKRTQALKQQASCSGSLRRRQKHQA